MFSLGCTLVLNVSLPFLNFWRWQVCDMFERLRTRKSTFRSMSEEYLRVLDVTSRFAVHHYHVAFSCKKVGVKQQQDMHPS